MSSAGAVRRREARAAAAFLSPWLLGFVFLTAGPVVATLVLSLTDYDVLTSTDWVGTDNYTRALQDPQVRTSLLNTVLYTLMYVPLSVVFGLALAVLIRRAGRAQGLMRTLIYLPVVTPPVASGVLFLLLLNGEGGLVNAVLGSVGLPTPYWTTDPTWIKPGIVVLSLWSVGSSAIILTAALGEVPETLLDAAVVDGAGPWRRFRHVVLPMVSPALFFVTVVSTIAALQLFTEVYTMYFGTVTTPGSDAALFYVIYLFQQAFRFFDMGYAAALSWLLFLLIMIVTAAQAAASRRLVHYRGD